MNHACLSERLELFWQYAPGVPLSDYVQESLVIVNGVLELLVHSLWRLGRGSEGNLAWKLMITRGVDYFFAVSGSRSCREGLDSMKNYRL